MEKSRTRVALPLTIALFYVLVILAHFVEKIDFIQHIASEDFDFNDIYYSIRDEDNDKGLNFEKHVVLINIGNAEFLERRKALIAILNELDLYDPAVVGVDVTFDRLRTDNPEDIAVDRSLIDAVNKYKPVMAEGIGDIGVFSDYAHLGLIDFPENPSIRSCYSEVQLRKRNIPTFPFALSKRFSRSGTYSVKDEFKIRYNSLEQGYYNAFDTISRPRNPNAKFPAIEAYDLLDLDKSRQLKKLISGKIVIVGVLGSKNMMDEFDIEDKFKVPTDAQIANRIPIMPGSVIFANVVEMALHDYYFLEIDGYYFEMATLPLLLIFYFVIRGCQHVDEYIKKSRAYMLNPVIKWTVIFLLTWASMQLCCDYLMKNGIYLSAGALLGRITTFIAAVHLYDEFSERHNKNKETKKTKRMKAKSIIFVVMLISFSLKAQNIYIIKFSGSVTVNDHELEPNSKFLVYDNDRIVIAKNAKALVLDRYKRAEIGSPAKEEKYSKKTLAVKLKQQKNKTALLPYVTSLYKTRQVDSDSRGSVRGAARGVNDGKTLAERSNTDEFFPPDTALVHAESINLKWKTSKKMIYPRLLVVNTETNDTIINSKEVNLQDNVRVVVVKPGLYKWIIYSEIEKKNKISHAFRKLTDAETQAQNLKLREFRKEVGDLSEEIRTQLIRDFNASNKIIE